MQSGEKFIDAARVVRQQRYRNSIVAYAAGSFIRGEATAYSDLDLVVIYERLPNAYRESFLFGHLPVEAFVHDPETLNYFFSESDRRTGIPALMGMVAEGIEVPESNAISRSLKALAMSELEKGPPALTVEERQRLRYAITNLIDDVRDPRSYSELIGTGTRLYEGLANYFLRTNDLWSANGKTIPRMLSRADSSMAKEFDDSFEALFRRADSKPVIVLADQIMRADGGFLFDGYRADAPSEWRKFPDTTRP